MVDSQQPAKRCNRGLLRSPPAFVGLQMLAPRDAHLTDLLTKSYRTLVSDSICRVDLMVPKEPPAAMVNRAIPE